MNFRQEYRDAQLEKRERERERRKTGRREIQFAISQATANGFWSVSTGLGCCSDLSNSPDCVCMRACALKHKNLTRIIRVNEEVLVHFPSTHFVTIAHTHTFGINSVNEIRTSSEQCYRVEEGPVHLGLKQKSLGGRQTFNVG